MVPDILLTCVVAALVLLVEHWFPWRLMLGRDLPRLAAYVLGVLAMVVPLTVLFAQRGELDAAIGMWAVMVSGGAAVMLAHGVDWVLSRLALAKELGELLTTNSGNELNELGQKQSADYAENADEEKGKDQIASQARNDRGEE
jgi:hypothetical protein